MRGKRRWIHALLKPLLVPSTTLTRTQQPTDYWSGARRPAGPRATPMAFGVRVNINITRQESKPCGSALNLTGYYLSLFILIELP